MWACSYENSDLPDIVDNLTAPYCSLYDFFVWSALKDVIADYALFLRVNLPLAF